MEKGQKVELEKEVQRKIDKSIDYFNEHGDVPPQLAILTINGLNNLPIPVKIFNSSSGKVFLGKQLRHLVTELEMNKIPVHKVIFISEAWMIERRLGDKGFDPENPPSASQEPDRKEKLLIQIETKEDSYMMAWDIHREEDKKPYVSKEPEETVLMLKEDFQDGYRGNFQVW